MNLPLCDVMSKNKGWTFWIVLYRTCRWFVELNAKGLLSVFLIKM